MLRAQLKEKARQPGPRHINAQATLELTVSLIVCVILLLGAAKIFVWINKSMVERQQAYRNTRAAPLGKIDFYTPPKMDIFGEER